MPSAGGGFEQAYNAQATVAMATLLVVGAPVTQHANDKQEVEPAVEELTKRPEDLGQVKRAALDNGYYSRHNMETLAGHGIEPFTSSRSAAKATIKRWKNAWRRSPKPPKTRMWSAR